MRETGPFTIKRERVGIQYRHTLMLYNAILGMKMSPSPIAPEWMRRRQATGNTAYFLDGKFQQPPVELTTRAVT